MCWLVWVQLGLSLQERWWWWGHRNNKTQTGQERQDISLRSQERPEHLLRHCHHWRNQVPSPESWVTLGRKHRGAYIRAEVLIWRRSYPVGVVIPASVMEPPSQTPDWLPAAALPGSVHSSVLLSHSLHTHPHTHTHTPPSTHSAPQCWKNWGVTSVIVFLTVFLFA